MLRFRDARKLSHEALEDLRRLGVSRVLAGESQPNVARSLHVTRTTVVRWMMAYRSGGEAALAARKPPGRPPRLSTKQRERLRASIARKSPQECGYAMPLWSLRLVAQVIEREFDVTLHETTISRMLRTMGLVPHRPTRQDGFQRDPREQQEQRVKERFPEIVGIQRSHTSKNPSRRDSSDRRSL